jgi:hypothetical protein
LEFVLSDDRIFYVLSDEYRKEIKELKTVIANGFDGNIYLAPAIVSRLAWLERLARIKIESILRICNNAPN